MSAVNNRQPRFSLHGILSVGMLYAGRTAGVIVPFIFFPLYNKLLGIEQFGLIVILLSLLALFVTLDLGMSAFISREVASKPSAPIIRKLIFTAEINISITYLVIFAFCALLKYLGWGLHALNFPLLALTTLLFLLMTLQNIHYSVLLANGSFAIASSIQFIGTLVRALITLATLQYYSATVSTFIVSQLAVVTLHFALTRDHSLKAFTRPYHAQNNHSITYTDCLKLLKNGSGLAILAASGAAVMQLDKPIIGAFFSSASVVPYFFATTACLLPISILASPVAQYFQPLIINATSAKDAVLSKKRIYQFTISLLIVTALPTILFWFFRNNIISLWLGSNGDVNAISEYVAILLPGVAFGALGYLPFTLLIANADFNFQAKASSFTAFSVLLLTAYFAFEKNINGICYTYVVYHFSSTIIWWVRAYSLNSITVLAKESALISFKAISIVILLFLAIFFVSKHF